MNWPLVLGQGQQTAECQYTTFYLALDKYLQSQMRMIEAPPSKDAYSPFHGSCRYPIPHTDLSYLVGLQQC